MIFCRVAGGDVTIDEKIILDAVPNAPSSFETTVISEISEIRQNLDHFETIGTCILIGIGIVAGVLLASILSGFFRRI